jgi:hypothetical protein
MQGSLIIKREKKYAWEGDQIYNCNSIV